MTLKISSIILIGLVFIIAPACNDDNVDLPLKEAPVSDDPLDQYIQENFVKEYGIAVRYKFVDRYVEPNKRVTPPKREIVLPMLNFLTDFWIDPFVSVPNGDKFFRRYVPAEMVFIGSPIFNNDGTITLGTADAGARITLTQVNDYDLNDKEWIITQIHTIYHEFAHIVHQNYNLPPGWKDISPKGYTSSGSWYTLTDEEAYERGFVTPYATSSFNEDFAETVATLLFDKDFYEKYTIDEINCTDAACTARNQGRALLRKKYDAIRAHYTLYTGVDLLAVRALVQAKLQ